MSEREPRQIATTVLEGAMARAWLEGDSRRLHRAREPALRLVDAAAGHAR